MQTLSLADTNDFQRVVEHHRLGIENAYYEALKKLNSYPAELRAEWTALTIAVVMHSHVCHSMRRVFADVPGAKPKQKKARAFILELDGAPIGIPEVVELIRRRHIQDTLDPSFGPPKTVDNEPPAHGNAGYILDALKTGFERLCVTYMRGLHSAELVLELSKGTRAEVLNLPIAQITEAPAKKKRVKPRKTIEAVPDIKRRVKIEAVKPKTDEQSELTKKKGQ